MKRRQVLFILSGAVSAGAGCSVESDSFGSTQTPTPSPRDTIPGSEGTLVLESKDFTLEGEGDFQTLTLMGRVRNISGETLKYVQIQARFKDASGAIIETALDNITDLLPDQVWAFEILYPGDPKANLESASLIADTIRY